VTQLSFKQHEKIKNNLPWLQRNWYQSLFVEVYGASMLGVDGDEFSNRLCFVCAIVDYFSCYCGSKASIYTSQSIVNGRCTLSHVCIFRGL
jgi:hypothetical protein